MLINDKLVYTQYYKKFGEITIRSFNLESDCKTLHKWVNMDYAFFWGLQNSSLEEVKREYKKLTEPDDYYVFVGMHKGEIVFFMELYNPMNDLIHKYYKVLPFDAGVHIITAPPQKNKIPNFTWFLFQSIMDFIFTKENVNRILVEPDIRNKKMFALCERIGFYLDKIVELPHKTAQLAFLNKQYYLDTIKKITPSKRSNMNTLDNVVSPLQSVHHIEQSVWLKSNKLLIKKAICEFTHERILTPKIKKKLDDGWCLFSLVSDVSDILYEFEGKLLELDHLMIRESTLIKKENELYIALDAVLFIKEFKKTLGFDNGKVPVYLEEIISTLYGTAFKITKGNPSVKELANADFQVIEQSMTEGHPGFVANNGRIGFDSSDYRSYAPESGNSFSLLWLAGHKSKAVYSAIEALPYDDLIKMELSDDTICQFNNVLLSKDLNPENYYFIPIHPWQWFNKLAMVFAPEIAKSDLVCLGYGPDQYLAQQSIRTLFNITNPKKFYTKSALSILNMGFMRGLPLYYLGTAPKMSVWLENLLYRDDFIIETGFKMLSEIGSVSYVNPYFQEFGPHNDYNKMLASLWRESPYSKIKEGQKPITMAALLHIDQYGNALLPEYIKTSGLSTEEWIRFYLKAYLSPLIHCFYTYDLVFMPHGENIILVLENNKPISILLKDITEEAVILNPDVVLPDELSRMYAPVPDDVKLLSIFTDVFDGFFRYLVSILEEHMNFSEQSFWKLVADNIIVYQRRYPQLEEKFKKYNLFADSFKLSCLNRLQLNNHKQMIDLDDPVALLQFAGEITNPLAIYSVKKEHEEIQ